MNRRKFLSSAILAGTVAATESFLPTNIFSQQEKEKKTMAFTLPQLPYAHDALEPYIDTLTMQIHHGKHHQAYVDNLNKAVTGTEWESKSLEEILANISKLAPAVRNNGGGHFNHSLFGK